MRALVLILFALPCMAQKWDNSKYFISEPREKVYDFYNWPKTIDGKQITSWGLFAISGIAHGAREAYHADPYVFEHNFDVGEYSFWAAKAWLRNYPNLDVTKPHKPEWFGNFGRDFWHTFNILDFAPPVTATFIIGTQKQPIKYRIANVLIGIGIRTTTSFITYELLR